MKKIMVHIGKNAGTALPIIEQAGNILANYGESVLVLTDDNGMNALTSSSLRFREIPTQPFVKLGAYEVDTQNQEINSTSALALSSASAITDTAKSYHILHLAGPMHTDWKMQLEQNSVEVEQNIDDDFYLVEIQNDKVDEVQALSFVESVTRYEPELKINPTLFNSELEAVIPDKHGLKLLHTDEMNPNSQQPENEIKSVPQAPAFQKQLAEANIEVIAPKIAGNAVFLAALQETGAKIIKVEEDRVIANASPESISKIARIEEVKKINPFKPFKLHNNTANGIIHGDVLQNTHGLNGRGQVVAIADTGLDTGVNNSTMSDDFEGRIMQIFALGRPGNASDTDGHGTHVAGSVLGSGVNSNGNVRGLAPNAQLIFQSIMDSSGNLGGIPGDLNDLFQQALDHGASIHTNSWGADVNGAYNMDSSQADQFCFNNRTFFILFSAGNAGPNRIGAPGTAKNVLTVGASESIRPLPALAHLPASPRFPTGRDFNFSGEANNQNQVTNFSSLGPAQNNRRKPDIVAPGSWILSTRSAAAVTDAGPDGIGPSMLPGGTGDEDGVATHDEAVGLGLPGAPIFGSMDQNTPPLPAGSGAGAEQSYMYLSGTSMATPIVAGACTLLRQFMIEQRSHVPSSALLKALVINGAVDMGLSVPHNGQGWGRVDLTNTLFPLTTNRVQFDDTLDNAVATGDIRSYTIFVSNGANPLTVTLVWRDAAGATIQNRLHLRVIHVDTGNTLFSDPIADIRNNVQKVIINTPVAGNYVIEVEGVNVTRGILEFPGAIRQDYALVVSNATGFSCNPSDIVQVIDRSGSMDFFGYLEPAKERAKQMVDILQINDKTGVTSFSDTATENFTLTQINSQNEKADAQAAIHLISGSGMTDLRAGLNQGRITLGPNTGRPQAIIFLSDGHHTTATPQIDNTFLNTFVASNIKVYTIALGPDSDFGVLNNIAMQTGTGSVNVVESAADLHKLHEIYYDILGNTGCNTVVHLHSAALGEIQTQSVLIDKSVREALFALSMDALTKTDFLLQDPSGNMITPGTSSASFRAGNTYQHYRIFAPKPGKWKLITKTNSQNTIATSAVMVDSDFTFRYKADLQFLFKGKLQLYLEAFYRNKPLTGAKVTAMATYATTPVQDIIKRYKKDLDRIKIPENLLKGDNKVDLTNLRLDKLAVQMRKEGKDIFERKVVKVSITDNGKEKDPKADDGIYTAFMDLKQRKVENSLAIKITIEGNHPEAGKYTRTKLISVLAPDL